MVALKFLAIATLGLGTVAANGHPKEVHEGRLKPHFPLRGSRPTIRVQVPEGVMVEVLHKNPPIENGTQQPDHCAIISAPYHPGDQELLKFCVAKKHAIEIREPEPEPVPEPKKIFPKPHNLPATIEREGTFTTSFFTPKQTNREA